MNVEIKALSKHIISDIPSGGGFFPFGIDGDAPYIVEYESQELELDGFFNKWMTKLNKFPIYALFSYTKIDEEEIDNLFTSSQIEYVKTKVKRERFIKAKIKNNKQFEVVMSTLYNQGNINEFAGWSLLEDIFSFDEREMKTFAGRKKVYMPIITLQKSSTMFWICYDGSSVVSISNDSMFSTSHSIVSSLPENIKINL
ncbi:hypothetical protein [Priestia endophytica]|uniref:hypothetical protein n=1 Tax=Priestia endophytica TaxID=135735 RepID=UPI002E1FAEA2|nr:hypothetical protein [Priestia endophytica]